MALSPRHIDDIGGYIYFSPLSRGASGKPVKIHTNLFVDLFCAINPNTNEGQTIIRDIESLRAKMATDSLPKPAMGPLDCPRDSARHREQLNRARKLQRAMMEDQHMRRERVLTTRNARIYYHINQQPGDRVPTVYISEVQVVGTSDHEGGLYDNQGVGRRSRFEKSRAVDMKNRHVFLTGSSKTPRDAFDEATYNTNLTNPAVFYIPRNVANQFRIAKDSRLGKEAIALSKELARLLSENKNNRVVWYVEGNGAGLLQHALNSVSASLENQSFKFINARGRLGDLLRKLNSKNAKMDGEFIGYNSDKGALLTLTIHKTEILEQLDKLPVPFGYERITRRYLKEQISALGRTGNASRAADQPNMLRGAGKTMVEVLMQVHGGC